MTLSLGYKLSSEEQSPADLVRQAQMAEDTGFDFALISDHYHPWTDRQGHQVGRDQKGFFEFYEQEILPKLKTLRPRRRARGRAGRPRPH